ncbi:MAG TPA: GNAT family N-acetyltransferase [Abditibacteriaceae bacterium]|jgi:ribosomal protein S18 acetylase RimI-like enzyme
MLQFQHPTADDIPAIVTLWNESFGPAWPMTETLLRQTMLVDPFYEDEGCWLARDNEKIVGWILSKSMKDAGPEWGRFQKNGGIGALCVHPDYQRRGIASQLLDRAEAFLQSHEVTPNLLYFPHHFLPGIPVECEAAMALFAKRGYKLAGESVDLWRALADYEIPAKAREAMRNNPTVELRPARADEAAKLIEFVAREFPGGWTYSTRGHFERGGDPADIVVAVEDETIIGFCHTADWNSPWLLPNVYWHERLGEHYGGLGPIGIGREHRKRGLGLAICAVAVDHLKDKGVERMAIDWTTLIAFYEQMGFQVWKRYRQASK